MVVITAFVVASIIIIIIDVLLIDFDVAKEDIKDVTLFLPPTGIGNVDAQLSVSSATTMTTMMMAMMMMTMVMMMTATMMMMTIMRVSNQLKVQLQ